jgi:L-glyceraldehyde 3-phosphate reductase
MQYRTVPRTDLSVSSICLGTMTFGTPVGEADAIRLTHWAIDHGVNSIDTANMYEGYARHAGSPGGVSEEILGRALKGRRAKVVLATKIGMKVGDAPEDEWSSPAAIRKHLQRSLARLGTDVIDIYYLHRPDPNTPVADTLSALADEIKLGKIRHYGISNYSADQTTELLRVADANGLPRPVMHQPPFSLLKPDNEQDLLPLLKTENIAAAVYQPLQGGLLTGKYRRGEPLPEGSRKKEKPQWAPELNDEVFDKLEALGTEAKKMGRTLMEHALKEALSMPAVVSLVVGVKRVDQLEGLIKALE